MKSVIIILLVLLLMSCTTLRHEDNLQEPYSQTEVEILGVGSIIVTALGFFTYGIITEANNF